MLAFLLPNLAPTLEAAIDNRVFFNFRDAKRTFRGYRLKVSVAACFRRNNLELVGSYKFSKIL
jgi:hypothetical protein